MRRALLGLTQMGNAFAEKCENAGPFARFYRNVVDLSKSDSHFGRFQQRAPHLRRSQQARATFEHFSARDHLTAAILGKGRHIWGILGKSQQS